MKPSPSMRSLVFAGAAIGVFICTVILGRYLPSGQLTTSFPVDRFESIRVGMSQTEVERLIGYPDFRGTPGAWGEEWIYKSHPMFPELHYHVVLKDATVVKKFVSDG